MSRDQDGQDPNRLDDPRLTAHALGEEAGPLTPEEQAEVDAIRATAETLKAGFAATPMPSLDQAHRNAILQGLSLDAAQPHRGAVPGSAVRLADYSGLGALAATLLLVVGFGIAGATGGGIGDGGDLHVKTFSPVGHKGEFLYRPAFGYGRGNGPARGGHLDDVTNGLDDRNPSGFDNGALGVLAANPLAASGTFNVSTVDIPPGVTVGLHGTLPESILHLKNAARRARSGAALPELRSHDSSYLSMGGGGGGGGHQYPGLSGRTGGVPAYSTWRGAGGAGGATGGIQPTMRGATRLPFNVGQGGFEEWVAGKQVGAVANQGDGEMDLFDVKDLTAGISEFPADDRAATASYLAIIENPWIRPYGEAALSTFSIDVDTAGYSIVRRSLMEQNSLPPPGALRVEELVNYFPYAYPGPVTADPFAVHVDAAACPWEPAHRLVRIALKGREVEEAVRPAANLVFLLDVSGSMAQPNKLPLVQKSIAMLTERLTARDRVAMVVYAGQSGLVLPSTPAGDHAPILAALDRLGAGGSTNGGAGIELAYKVAQENFVPGGINRVVLATDGDFNVGVSDPSALVKMVEEKAKNGVFLTALGYGYDNLKDSTLEQLADKGNGNYGYVDNLAEARKVLVEQGMSTLHCIAKDVKIQVEFNPAKVAGYRLLGYENRMLAAQDFADDQKDAGEIGAGHTVTALYEVVPAGVEVPGAPVDELRYQRPGAFSGNAETLVVKLRWKEPEGAVSTPREFPFVDAGLPFGSASEDFRFAAAVAAFGLVLRDSKCAGSANLDLVREIAAGAVGADAGGWRAEFVTLVEKAKTLKR